MASRGGWLDISVPISDGMIRWPGDPAPHVSRSQDLGRGDDYSVTHLDISAHTGTHVDAPAHFFRRGETVDAMPPDAMIGPARVLRIQDPEQVTADELARFDVQPGERLLLQTHNSDRRWWEEPLSSSYVHLSPEAALYLAGQQVKLLGIDALSVDGPQSARYEAHRTLLSAGVWVVEGLDLTQAEPGQCELLCLPLRLAGADGAPARVLMRSS